mmetsp:Transcript_88276/g.252465  ORF Transcript_88276/g.252465 Transcript_88276/m.252465 type:complete len:262 (-) Transcript_88276:63-848(-)
MSMLLFPTAPSPTTTTLRFSMTPLPPGRRARFTARPAPGSFRAHAAAPAGHRVRSDQPTRLPTQTLTIMLYSMRGASAESGPVLFLLAIVLVEAFTSAGLHEAGRQPRPHHGTDPDSGAPGHAMGSGGDPISPQPAAQEARCDPCPGPCLAARHQRRHSSKSELRAGGGGAEQQGHPYAHAADGPSVFAVRHGSEGSCQVMEGLEGLGQLLGLRHGRDHGSGVPCLAAPSRLPRAGLAGCHRRRREPSWREQQERPQWRRQ